MYNEIFFSFRKLIIVKIEFKSIAEQFGKFLTKHKFKFRFLKEAGVDRRKFIPSLFTCLPTWNKSRVV